MGITVDKSYSMSFAIIAYKNTYIMNYEKAQIKSDKTRETERQIKCRQHDETDNPHEQENNKYDKTSDGANPRRR